MQITVNLKARKMEATTKSQLLGKLRGNMFSSSFHNTYGSQGHHLLRRDRSGQETIRLFTLEKFRRKTKVTTRTITRGKNKGQVERKVETLRRGHWVAHYYDVPAVLVEKASQGKRSFELKLKGL